MLIALALGTVRTPVFTSKGSAYFIALEFRRSSVSYQDLICKIGALKVGEHSDEFSKNCKAQPLIETNWRVLDGDQEIAHGSDGGFSQHVELNSKVIRRYIGDYYCEPNHKYVVEVTFVKNGSALDFAHPRLVVMQPEASF